jgi:hypothetical protein
LKRKKAGNPMFESPKGPKKIRSVIDAIDPQLRVSCDRDTYFCHSKETVKEMKKGEPDEKALSTMLKVREENVQRFHLSDDACMQFRC